MSRYKDIKRYIIQNIETNLNILLDIKNIDINTANVEELRNILSTIQSKTEQLNTLLFDLVHLGIKQSSYTTLTEYTDNIPDITLNKDQLLETTITAAERIYKYWYITDLTIFNIINTLTKKSIDVITSIKKYYYTNLDNVIKNGI